jgi:hypothetical protein
MANRERRRFMKPAPALGGDDTVVPGGLRSVQDDGGLIAHGCGSRPSVWCSRADCPILETVNPRFKLWLFVAFPWTERRDRPFVARDVGSVRFGVTGSIEAA